MKVVIYARCSTMSQEFKRQIDELSSFAISQNWEVSKIFSEKISGAKSSTERPELTKLIEYVKKGKIDKVVNTVQKIKRMILKKAA